MLEKTKEIVDKTLGETDRQSLLQTFKNDKGILGKFVETGFYAYPLNKLAQFDFENLSVELKVSGFITLQMGVGLQRTDFAQSN